MTIPNTRKVLIIATAVIALTSGCASYTCEHDYGLSKGTTDFSNCMVYERALNLRRAALLGQIGDDLLRTYHHPVVYAPPPQQYYCQGSVQGNGSFSATCN